MVLTRIDGTPGCQIVADWNGIDTAVWQDSGHAVPDDLASRAYTFDETGAVPVATQPPAATVDVLNVLVAADVITRAKADEIIAAGGNP